MRFELLYDYLLGEANITNLYLKDRAKLAKINVKPEITIPVMQKNTNVENSKTTVSKS